MPPPPPGKTNTLVNAYRIAESDRDDAPLSRGPRVIDPSYRARSIPSSRNPALEPPARPSIHDPPLCDASALRAGGVIYPRRRFVKSHLMPRAPGLAREEHEGGARAAVWEGRVGRGTMYKGIVENATGGLPFLKVARVNRVIRFVGWEVLLKLIKNDLTSDVYFVLGYLKTQIIFGTTMYLILEV